MQFLLIYWSFEVIKIASNLLIGDGFLHEGTAQKRLICDEWKLWK